MTIVNYPELFAALLQKTSVIRGDGSLSFPELEDGLAVANSAYRGTDGRLRYKRLDGSIWVEQGLPFTTETTNATPVILTRGGAAPDSTNVFVLTNNSAVSGTLVVQARNTAGDCAFWVFAFQAKRNVGAATTEVIYAPTIATNIQAGLTGVAASVVANTTRGSVEVQVTGLPTPVTWSSTFTVDELT